MLVVTSIFVKIDHKLMLVRNCAGSEARLKDRKECHQVPVHASCKYVRKLFGHVTLRTDQQDTLQIVQLVATFPMSFHVGLLEAFTIPRLVAL